MYGPDVVGGLLTLWTAQRAARPTRSGGYVRLAAAGAALLCLLILAACAAPPALPDPMRMLVQSFSPEEVIAFIGQPFPPSASEIHLMGEAALDTVVIARFDIPRQDIAPWLAGLGVTAALEPAYSPFFSTRPPFGEASSWWAPPIAGDKTGNFSGLYQQVGSKQYEVVVVEAEGDQVTVYLQVFNT